MHEGSHPGWVVQPPHRLGAPVLSCRVVHKNTSRGVRRDELRFARVTGHLNSNTCLTAARASAYGGQEQAAERKQARSLLTNCTVARLPVDVEHCCDPRVIGLQVPYNLPLLRKRLRRRRRRRLRDSRSQEGALACLRSSALCQAGPAGAGNSQTETHRLGRRSLLRLRIWRRWGRRLGFRRRRDRHELPSLHHPVNVAPADESTRRTQDSEAVHELCARCLPFAADWGITLRKMLMRHADATGVGKGKSGR